LEKGEKEDSAKRDEMKCQPEINSTNEHQKKNCVPKLKTEKKTMARKPELERRRLGHQ